MTAFARRLKDTLVGNGVLLIAGVLVGVFVIGLIFGGLVVSGVRAVSDATGAPFTLLLVAFAVSMWLWNRRR